MAARRFHGAFTSLFMAVLFSTQDVSSLPHSAVLTKEAVSCHQKCKQLKPVSGCFETGASVDKESGRCACSCVVCKQEIRLRCDDLAPQQGQQCVSHGNWVIMDPNGALACCIPCLMYNTTLHEDSSDEAKRNEDLNSSSGNGSGSESRSGSVLKFKTPTACQLICSALEPVAGCFEMGPGLDGEGNCVCSCLSCDEMWDHPYCDDSNGVGKPRKECMHFGRAIVDPKGIWQCCKPCLEYENKTLEEYRQDSLECQQECGLVEPVVGCLEMGGSRGKDGHCICTCVQCSDRESPSCDLDYESHITRSACVRFASARMDPSGLWQCCKPCEEFTNTTDTISSELIGGSGQHTYPSLAEFPADPAPSSKPISAEEEFLPARKNNAASQRDWHEETATSDNLSKGFPEMIFECQTQCRQAEPMFGCFEMGPALDKNGHCQCKCTVCSNISDAVPICQSDGASKTLNCVLFGESVPDPSDVWQCCRPCLQYEKFLPTEGSKLLAHSTDRTAPPGVASTFHEAVQSAVTPAVVKSNTLCNGTKCGRHHVCRVIHGQAACLCQPKCPLHSRPVCGSDNRTYFNRCALHQFACKHNQVIHIRHRGACVTITQPLQTDKFSS